MTSRTGASEIAYDATISRTSSMPYSSIDRGQHRVEIGAAGVFAVVAERFDGRVVGALRRARSTTAC